MKVREFNKMMKSKGYQASNNPIKRGWFNVFEITETGTWVWVCSTSNLDKFVK